MDLPGRNSRKQYLVNDFTIASSAVSSRKSHGSVGGRHLRKAIYSTVLFVCLSVTLVSLKAARSGTQHQSVRSASPLSLSNQLANKRAESIGETYNLPTAGSDTGGGGGGSGDDDDLSDDSAAKLSSTTPTTTLPTIAVTKQRGTKTGRPTKSSTKTTTTTTSKSITSSSPEPTQSGQSGTLPVEINNGRQQSETNQSTGKNSLGKTTTNAAGSLTRVHSTSASIQSSTTASTTTAKSVAGHVVLLKDTIKGKGSVRTGLETNSTATTATTTMPSIGDASSKPTVAEKLCDEPAYHEFPDDLFSNKQRSQGAVIIHILVGIYMFYALAIVCDEYFVSSMEKICEKMGLSEDVAGATFMAAGSSAPELFTSLLGVFVAKGDVGTGTIIGSAVFNILFVIGICAVFAGQVVPLNWWPLLRDSFYYAIAVVVLIAVLADSEVTWYESIIMLLMYGIYILIMRFNVKIKIWLTDHTPLRHMDELTQATQGILFVEGKQPKSSYVQFTNGGDEMNSMDWRSPASDPNMPLDEIIRDYPRYMTLFEAALIIMSSRYFRGRTRFRCAAKRLIAERRHIRRHGYPNKSIVINEYDNPNSSTKLNRDFGRGPREDWMATPSVANQGIFTVVRWFIKVPVHATLYYTIPDCRSARWERWYLLTFFTAMVWIALFSYILVWMVTLVGYTLGIPDTIMGITFLAAGTSIPDAYASLLVARQGLGDMAVSNSIGSNVFDILIGLALPWFLQTAMVDRTSTLMISSRGMVYNVILLFLSIAATIAAVHYCRWQMNKRLGFILLVTYVVFLTFSILIEFNVFGFVNLPECDE